MWCHSYTNSVHFKVHILQQNILQNVLLRDGFPSATTRAWPSTTNYEVPSMLSVRTSEMTGLFPPGRQAQVQTSSLLRLQSETYIVRKSPSTECWECFLWFKQFLLLSSMCHLATPRCDLDQPCWICRLIPFVEAQWLSGRMPDSRSRGHSHESSTHIGAVDDDSLWRCYATTKYNNCPIALWNKLWFILCIYNPIAPLKLLNDSHRKLIYLCKMYDSPPGIVGMIISMKNIGQLAQTNKNIKCHLSYLWWTAIAHPPSACTATKSESVDFCLCSFPKSWHNNICSRNVPIVKSVTSSSLSVVVSKWARLTRRRLRSSSCSWR